jgi:hypothetical protein
MPPDGQFSIFGSHALTIILHDNLIDPTTSDADTNSPRAGVYGVFYQLLDYRSWSLDNLTSTDLFDRLKIKQVNTAHK